MDWKKVMARRITVKELVQLARGLVEPNSDENPEYQRALAELVTDAARLSMDFKNEVARKIGLKAKID
ncbi:MAG: hypothetical protein ACREDF_04010 [Thermoplasmata archaeon]